MAKAMDYENIKPYIFVTNYLIKSTQPEAKIMVCIKPDNPKDKHIGWKPTPLLEDTPMPSTSNLYVSLSSCTKLNDTTSDHHNQYRNQLSCAAQTHMFMLDDLGDETTPNKPDYNKLPITPTWIIETSPNNYQALYVLTEPLNDIALASQITKQLPGQTRSDKSAVNAVRWARLPGGTNNKPEHLDQQGKGFNVRIKQANPDCTYHTSQIIDDFNLELGQKERTKPTYNAITGQLPRGWSRHISALCAIPPEIDYNTWFNVACVFHAWGPNGLQAFIEWSIGSTIHNLTEEEITSKFNDVSFDSADPKGHDSVVSWPWLEARAREHGWNYDHYSRDESLAIIKQLSDATTTDELRDLSNAIHDAYLNGFDLEYTTTKLHEAFTKLGEKLTLNQVRKILDPEKKIDPKDPFWTYPLTDEGNLDRFKTLYKDLYYFVPENNLHIQWEDGKWINSHSSQCVAIDTINHIVKMETKPLDDAQNKAIHKWRTTCGAYGHISPLTSMINRDQTISKSVHDLNSEPTLIGMPGQILNLENGLISSAMPQHLITMQTAVRYDEAASCPRWKQFILEIMNGDKQLASFLQLLAGYSLIGGNPEQVFVVLNGEGANGKSTFTSTLQHIMHDYSVTAGVETITRPAYGKSAGAASPDLVNLFRKRLVICNEWNENTYINESLIKVLSGGTDAISVRALYANQYISYIPEFLLMLATNHTPKIASMDYGIWRRLLIIPFLVNFDAPENKAKRDTQLMAYFKEKEALGIFNWMVEGYHMWRDTGVVNAMPASIEHVKEEYKEEMDTVGQFLREKCITTDLDDRIKSSDLYMAYTIWSTEQGNKAKALRTFSTAIIKKGHKRVRLGSVNGFGGVRLLTLSEISEAEQASTTTFTPVAPTTQKTRSKSKRLNS